MIRLRFRVIRGLRKGKGMNILLRVLKKIIIIVLCLVIIPVVFYYFFTYKDLVFSFWAKKEFQGRIIYSIKTTSDLNVKIIDFPSGRKHDIYTSIPRGQTGYHPVNSLSFSRDGHKVVFSRMGTKMQGYRFKLYTMNSDGTNIKELLGLEGLDAKYPSWSPDGKKIAFIVQKSYGKGSLYVINVDKPYSSLKLISNIRPAVFSPTWSPDSQRISFVSDEYFNERINERWRVEKFVGNTFIIDNDGIGLRKLKVREPVSWSPDGKLLLYGGVNGFYISDENQLYNYLLIPYKRPPVKLFFNDPSFAIWSPDGKYIAYVNELWPGICGLGIYIVPIDNPQKQVCIAVENSEISDMVWVK